VLCYTLVHYTVNSLRLGRLLQPPRMRMTRNGSSGTSLIWVVAVYTATGFREHLRLLLFGWRHFAPATWRTAASELARHMCSCAPDQASRRCPSKAGHEQLRRDPIGPRQECFIIAAHPQATHTAALPTRKNQIKVGFHVTCCLRVVQ
jgi:hypothetical protein